MASPAHRGAGRRGGGRREERSEEVSEPLTLILSLFVCLFYWGGVVFLFRLVGKATFVFFSLSFSLTGSHVPFSLRDSYFSFFVSLTFKSCALVHFRFSLFSFSTLACHF